MEKIKSKGKKVDFSFVAYLLRNLKNILSKIVFFCNLQLSQPQGILRKNNLHDMKKILIFIFTIFLFFYNSNCYAQTAVRLSKSHLELKDNNINIY